MARSSAIPLPGSISSTHESTSIAPASCAGATSAGRKRANGSRPSRYDPAMDVFAQPEAPAAAALRDREQIPARYKWDLTRIFSDWNAWQAGYAALDEKIGAFTAFQGRLATGADTL